MTIAPALVPVPDLLAWPDPARARAFVSDHLPALEAALVEAVTAPVPGLPVIDRVMANAVGVGGAGGRRWRPLLAMAAASAAGREAAAGLPVAIAVELTHTASLVLDDLPCMDDSATRRGQAATHRLVGASGAILVAIGLLGRAAQALGVGAFAAGEITTDWGTTIGLAGMSGGQAIDVAQTGSGPAHGAPRRLLRKKTTALSEFAAFAGARSAGADRQTATALAAFGRDLGWAYQLADDVRDAAEDRDAGRSESGRSPLRQSQFILRRAERRLVGVSGVTREGLELLIGFARDLVPAGANADAGVA